MKRIVLVCAATVAAGLLAPPAHAAPSLVAVSSPYAAGTILISNRERALYLLLGNDAAIRYPVAVGKAGKSWRGLAHIDGKYIAPTWSPPDEVRRDHPSMPAEIAGGAPNNPMGVRALTLDRSEIAIHGTTRAMRKSVGTYASYGCIRMLNEDVVDLFARVRVGTPVIALP